MTAQRTTGPIAVGAYLATPSGPRGRDGSYVWALTGPEFSKSLGRFTPDKIDREVRFVLDELEMPIHGPVPEPVALPRLPKWARINPGAKPGMCRLVGHDHAAQNRGFCYGAYARVRRLGGKALIEAIALPKARAGVPVPGSIGATERERERLAGGPRRIRPGPSSPIGPDDPLPAWVVLAVEPAPDRCIIEGCGRLGPARGLCLRHDNLVRRQGFRDRIGSKPRTQEEVGIHLRRVAIEKRIAKARADLAQDLADLAELTR